MGLAGPAEVGVTMAVGEEDIREVVAAEVGMAAATEDIAEGAADSEEAEVEEAGEAGRPRAL